MLLRRKHEPKLLRQEGKASAFVRVNIFRDTASSMSEVKSQILPETIMDESDNCSQPKNDDGIQTILLCTKANDAIPALAGVLGRINEKSRIIILSNGGLAIRDEITKKLGARSPIIELATTTNGAYLTNEFDPLGFSVVHAGIGSTYSSNADFIRAVRRARIGGAVLLSNVDMNVMLWKKIAVNCVINPITAMRGVKNGQLLEMIKSDSEIRHLVDEILIEVSNVALAEINTDKLLAIDEKALIGVNHELSAPSLKDFVLKVATETQSNVSSMLQDIRNKRKTEVLYLNGYVAGLGKNIGSDCNANQAMCCRIEDMGG